MRALFKGLVWLTLIVGAIVGILRATCISFWTIPGDDALFSLSIMPTLEAGDLVVLWRVGAPGFGDLVRCSDPEVAEKHVVGRLLGEQGDQIVAQLGTVRVNNQLISSMRACQPSTLSVIDPTTGEAFELFCEVFIASDDRYYHDDSRDFGPVPKDSCQERVVFRLWSARGWFDTSRRLMFVR